MSRRVLITGGTGFIGQRTVSAFLTDGFDVRTFALPGEATPAPWGERVDVRTGNLLDPGSLKAASAGCDVVVHLAGLVGHGGDYDRQWSIFVDGTRNVCLAAAEAGARLVVCTSIAVYGTLIQTHVCEEALGHGPWAGAYGRAKQGQELVSLQLAVKHAIPLTILRPANVYGIGGGGAWGDRLLASIRETGAFVIGDGDANDAGLVHVDNLAEAIVLASTQQQAIGEIYNVCDESGVSWARFMSDMARLAGRPPPTAYPVEDILRLIAENENPARMESPKDPALPFLEGVNLVGFSNRIPSGKIRRELGWRPQILYSGGMAIEPAN